MENDYIYIGCLVLSVLINTANNVCFNTLIMEIYGIKESVVIGGILLIISKVSEVSTTVSAFLFSFFFEKLELKTPYKMMYLITSLFSGISAVLLFIENTRKFVYVSEITLLNEVKEEKIIKEDKE